MCIRLRPGGYTKYCHISHTLWLIYTSDRLKRTSKASLRWGKKVKIYGVENAFLSQSDYQQGASVQAIISYTFSPRAVHWSIFRALCSSNNSKKKKGWANRPIPLQVQSRASISGRDAISEAFPLSHLFTGLIHPSTPQKPGTMQAESLWTDVHVLLLFNGCWLSELERLFPCQSLPQFRPRPRHIPAGCDTRIQHGGGRGVPLL